MNVAHSTGTVTTYANHLPDANDGEPPHTYLARVALYLRESRGLTKVQAAKNADTTRRYIERVEQGKAQSVKKLLAYFCSYGLDMEINFETKPEKEKE